MQDCVLKLIAAHDADGEDILFSDHVVKISRKGQKQKRILLVTNKAIYNLHKGLFFDKLVCKRGPVDFENVEGISVCNKSNQSIIHLVEG